MPLSFASFVHHTADSASTLKYDTLAEGAAIIGGLGIISGYASVAVMESEGSSPFVVDLLGRASFGALAFTATYFVAAAVAKAVAWATKKHAESDISLGSEIKADILGKTLMLGLAFGAAVYASSSFYQGSEHETNIQREQQSQSNEDVLRQSFKRVDMESINSVLKRTVPQRNSHLVLKP